ncbi:Zn2/Cys6 DNA-binding protein [Glarea lozoyensis ATCC 20868]|uniref:Zn2/Cys6 DNA-binding protein n=1 Tax=Glarea lozoyensis (strain ATCC 20868 / MF5171) TaxID=1116229 RepID=S3D2U1_GLAL2|nr:Zn2/Cys6 DNA-binding protein [Glarea lozoyensis ATCC 20868]EPE26356.1 Zn2/Cys6 DNA-binding protein [Glarea lozoyensis ATCC 20868]
MDGTAPVEPEAVKAAPSLRKRRRPALSCAECRRRKIKCDRNIPCGPCRQAKSATCTYSPEGLARKSHGIGLASPAMTNTTPSGPEGEFFTDRITHIVNGPEPSPPPTLSHPPSEPRSTSPCQSTASSLGGQDVRGLLNRVQKLEAMLASTSIDDRHKSTNILQESSKELRGNLSKTRWFGPSHWMHAFSQTRKIICFEFNIATSHSIILTDKTADKELNILIDRCKAIARLIKAAQVPQWTLWGTTFKHSIPSREAADKLVANYFRTHEANHRVLHIPSFMKEYNQFFDSPQTASAVSSVKVMLVMAIGVCFCQNDDFHALRHDATQWIYAAQSWLSSPNEKAKLHISLIQIQCLTLIARPLFSISGDLVWITLGTVIRTAIQMALHRDPKHFPRISPFHGEIRRRLWATILELNVVTSLETGMIPMISEDQYDTEHPANINDEDISESTTERPTSKPTEVFTQTSTQLLILQSFTTRQRVAQLINDIRFDPSYDEVLQIGTTLMKHYRDNHTFLTKCSEEPTQGAHKPSVFHRKLVDLNTQRFLLALHHPFALKARTDPRFYYSHKVYIECALAVMSYHDTSEPSSPLLSDGKNQDDYTRLRLASGGHLKDVIVHAALVIYLELIIPLEEDPSLAFTQERMPQRSPFRKFLVDTLELSRARMETCETNMKGHLVLSIALAHVDAMEQGQPSEERVISAARESLVLCERLLTERLPKSTETSVYAGGLEEQLAFSQQDVDMAMQDWGMMDYDTGANNDYWLWPAWTEGAGFMNAGRADNVL